MKRQPRRLCVQRSQALPDFIRQRLRDKGVSSDLARTYIETLQYAANSHHPTRVEHFQKLARRNSRSVNQAQDDPGSVYLINNFVIHTLKAGKRYPAPWKLHKCAHPDDSGLPLYCYIADNGTVVSITPFEMAVSLFRELKGYVAMEDPNEARRKEARGGVKMKDVASTFGFRTVEPTRSNEELTMEVSELVWSVADDEMEDEDYFDEDEGEEF